MIGSVMNQYDEENLKQSREMVEQDHEWPS
jgi:hypothetical protein